MKRVLASLAFVFSKISCGGCTSMDVRSECVDQCQRDELGLIVSPGDVVHCAPNTALQAVDIQVCPIEHRNRHDLPLVFRVPEFVSLSRSFC
ncbi:hypothetical protein BDR26DRAFT_859433 [Obelidium mucronatum]|nr:hypothetical protein BDR26DRAFT_859433 [Obelidium mucronatum]